jgi:hypothetical protein
MTEDGWCILLFILALVVLGLKIVALLLVGYAIYWVLTGGPR